MVAIIDAREVWERVAEVHPRNLIVYEHEVLLGYTLSAEWFLEHRGHTLAVRSEYGYLLHDCSAQFTCGECKTAHICRRKKGHEGPHSTTRDYDPGERPDG
jgi:hypothetical protein